MLTEVVTDGEKMELKINQETKIIRYDKEDNKLKTIITDFTLEELTVLNN